MPPRRSPGRRRLTGHTCKSYTYAGAGAALPESPLPKPGPETRPRDPAPKLPNDPDEPPKPRAHEPAMTSNHDGERPTSPDPSRSGRGEVVAVPSTSEHASRLAAMQSAEKNIEERVDDLENRYNRRRQSSLTEELMDITSGFVALAEDGGSS